MTAIGSTQRVAKLESTTDVFYWNYYDRQNRVKVNQGGTSSSKTYSILQVIALRCIEEKRIATIVGQDMPNLKKGALRDFIERILVADPWIGNCILTYNKSNVTFTFYNGSIMEFVSYDDEQDAKNGKRDILFVNEANGVPYAIYKQLAMRTDEEIFVDYNPTASFWVHEHLIGREGVVVFYSNFTHNQFTPIGTIYELQDIKEREPELWKVYGLGKTGEIHELCIENMTIVDKMPSRLRSRGYGIDFGYRADPTAFVNCGIANERDIYFDLMFYQYRMKVGDITKLFGLLGIKKRRKMLADGSDGRAVDHIKGAGYNIRAADKGPGSIAYGLSLLNQSNIHVTARSIDMINERKKYSYRVEKRGPKAGEVTNQPVDAFNHAWDAARYWAIDSIKPRSKKSRGLRGQNV